MKDDAFYKDKTLSLTKKLISGLKFVVDDILEKLDSDDEHDQVNAVIHANALLECIPQYEANVKALIQKLENQNVFLKNGNVLND